MTNQFMAIFLEQLGIHGVNLFGSLMVAVAFGIFFEKNTQYARFRAISIGFWVLTVLSAVLITIPCLPLLNPAFATIKNYVFYIQSIVYAISGGLFLTSLFPNAPAFIRKLFFPPFFACVLIGAGYALYISKVLEAVPVTSLPTLLLGCALIISALGFYTIRALGQKMIFSATRMGLIFLGGYFVLLGLHIITDAPLIAAILYGLITLLVLTAQLRFMATTASAAQQLFEKEHAKKTLLWDVAPSPVLLTRLTDDSIVYMNSACQKALHLTAAQTTDLRFSDYFLDTKKTG